MPPLLGPAGHRHIIINAVRSCEDPALVDEGGSANVEVLRLLKDRRMPGPLRHLRFAFLPRVETFPATFCATWCRKDPNRLSVVRNKAADVVVGQAAVGMGSSTSKNASPILHAVTIEV